MKIPAEEALEEIDEILRTPVISGDLENNLPQTPIPTTEKSSGKVKKLKSALTPKRTKQSDMPKMSTSSITSSTDLPRELDPRTSIEIANYQNSQKGHAIAELITTEREYVSNLVILLQYRHHFLNHLSKVVTANEIQILFSNVEIILQLNQKFLCELESAKDSPDSSTIIQIFAKYVTKQKKKNPPIG